MSRQLIPERGIFLGLALCYVLYLLPVLVVTGATDYDQTDWVDGHWATLTAANDIGGKFLSKWTVFAISYGYPTSLFLKLKCLLMHTNWWAWHGGTRLPSKLVSSRKGQSSAHQLQTAGILTGTLVIVIFSVADFNATNLSNCWMQIMQLHYTYWWNLICRIREIAASW